MLTRDLFAVANLLIAGNFSNPKLHQYAMVTFSLTALLAIAIRFRTVLSHHHLLLASSVNSGLLFSPVISVSCLLVTLVTCQSRSVPALVSCKPHFYVLLLILMF